MKKTKITDYNIPTYWVTQSGMLRADAVKFLEHLHEHLHELKTKPKETKE